MELWGNSKLAFSSPTKLFSVSISSSVLSELNLLFIKATPDSYLNVYCSPFLSALSGSMLSSPNAKQL